MMPGISEWLIIGFVVVLLFGTTKLPKLGGAIGESIRNFKKGIKDNSVDEEETKSLPKEAKNVEKE